MREYYFDEDLKDVAKNPAEFESYVLELQKKIEAITVKVQGGVDGSMAVIEKTTDPNEKNRLLGELGNSLRILRRLPEARDALKQAVDLCEAYNLGLEKTIQQQIRLAHVLQWEGNFVKSNRLFGELIITSESGLGLSRLQPFIYQHAGKNLFDQKMYPQALKFFEKALKLRQQQSQSAPNTVPQDQIDSTLFAIEQTKKRIG